MIAQMQFGRVPATLRHSQAVAGGPRAKRLEKEAGPPKPVRAAYSTALKKFAPYETLGCELNTVALR